MDDRKRLDLWRAIDAYANHRTPASWEDVELVVDTIVSDTIAVDFARFMGKVKRSFAACEAKSLTPRSEDIVAANPMVPNANGDILPGIQFEVVAEEEVSLPEMQPREVLTVSERFMRQVDAKILAEIEQTVAGLPKPEDLP
jgi:hypothetical protein